MPRQTSVQLTEATERQAAELKAAGYGTLTDVVRIAIDNVLAGLTARKWMGVEIETRW